MERVSTLANTFASTLPADGRVAAESASVVPAVTPDRIPGSLGGPVVSRTTPTSSDGAASVAPTGAGGSHTTPEDLLPAKEGRHTWTPPAAPKKSRPHLSRVKLTKFLAALLEEEESQNVQE